MSAPRHWIWVPVTLALCLSGLVALLPPKSPAAITAEVVRIRHHLMGAEQVLQRRDLSALTAAQREARAQRIADLRTYRQGGVFPHNHRRLTRTPVFVDEHGTRCAMAHLIERSGATALVARIARNRNLARIRDLAGDPELVAWLDANGLTLAEAARIQPAYDGSSGNIVLETHTAQWAAAGVGAAMGATGIALNASVATTQEQRNTRGLTGVALGMLSVVFSVPALLDEGDLRAVGFVDLVLGATSVGMGVRNIEARVPDERFAAATSITPAAWRERDGTRRLALVVRF